MTVTLDDLKKAKFRQGFHLDGQGFYQNHFSCTDYPRLGVVETGPRGKASKTAKFGRRFFVDGMECPDLDAVLTLLNAELREAKAS
jgi:hypothetical protein